MAAGMEGTPWVSVEVERASEADRPYGWIVTVRTPGRLECRPCRQWSEATAEVAALLEDAIRREISVVLTRAEPLPPARRVAS